MGKANADIRKAAQENGIYLWQIADEYGLTEGHFCKVLRHELPAEKKERIFEIIKGIVNARG